MVTDDAGPNLDDIEIGLVAVLYLHDAAAPKAVRDRLADTPFRDRRIDSFDLTVKGVLEASKAIPDAPGQRSSRPSIS